VHEALLQHNLGKVISFPVSPAHSIFNLNLILKVESLYPFSSGQLHRKDTEMIDFRIDRSSQTIVVLKINLRKGEPCLSLRML
jgi:hypothetical protein